MRLLGALSCTKFDICVWVRDCWRHQVLDLWLGLRLLAAPSVSSMALTQPSPGLVACLGCCSRLFTESFPTTGRHGSDGRQQVTPCKRPTLSRNPAMDTSCPTEPVRPREDTLILPRLILPRAPTQTIERYNKVLLWVHFLGVLLTTT